MESKTKLLDHMRYVLRLKHMSIRTESKGKIKPLFTCPPRSRQACRSPGLPGAAQRTPAPAPLRLWSRLAWSPDMAYTLARSIIS
jgi:hypothetical protein